MSVRAPRTARVVRPARSPLVRLADAAPPSDPAKRTRRLSYADFHSDDPVHVLPLFLVAAVLALPVARVGPPGGTQQPTCPNDQPERLDHRRGGATASGGRAVSTSPTKAKETIMTALSRRSRIRPCSSIDKGCDAFCSDIPTSSGRWTSSTCSAAKAPPEAFARRRGVGATMRRPARLGGGRRRTCHGGRRPAGALLSGCPAAADTWFGVGLLGGLNAGWSLRIALDPIGKVVGRVSVVGYGFPVFPAGATDIGMSSIRAVATWTRFRVEGGDRHGW